MTGTERTLLTLISLAAVALVGYAVVTDHQLGDVSRRLAALEDFEQGHDMHALRHVEQVRIMDEMHRLDRQIADYRRLHYADELSDEDQIAMESLIDHWVYLNGKLDGIRGGETQIGSWSPSWGPRPDDELVYIDTEDGTGVLPKLSGEDK